MITDKQVKAALDIWNDDWRAYPEEHKAASLADMRAALEAVEAAAWRPIETAPRDGSDFLALIPWQKKHHQMVGCMAPDGKFRSWPCRSRYDPTHWRPLPDPTKEPTP